MSAIRRLQSVDERPDEPRDTASDMEMVRAAVADGILYAQENTPATYRDAVGGKDEPHWRKSMAAEIDACLARCVWRKVKLSDLPPGTNILPNKWVYKIKLDANGAVARYKSRICPKGFRQKFGVDYAEVFAHTGAYKTFRLLMSLTAALDYDLLQMDVPEAFLNGDLEEEVYMELPEGFKEEGYVVKLLKALYGLKQAPHNWDRLVHTFMLNEAGWRATESDRSLYFKRSATGRLMFLFRFVDDFLGSRATADAAEFQRTVDALRARFNIKLLPEANMFLGMRITRDRVRRTIRLDQAQYIESLLVRYGMADCKPASTPEATGGGSAENGAESKPTDRQRYMEITGSVMYAAHAARPDIAHAAYRRACSMQAPTEADMVAAKRILRYLSGTRAVGLLFGASNNGGGAQKGDLRVVVSAYADADWANNKEDRRSVTGWLSKLNGDAISWAAKKQRTVALSTCEAELYAEAAVIQEVLWLRGMLAELGLHVQPASTVFGDNQSTVAVSKNGIKGERTKHVDVKYKFVTETVERGDVRLQWIPTTQQQADIFTKALGEQLFVRFRKEIMSE